MGGYRSQFSSLGELWLSENENTLEVVIAHRCDANKLRNFALTYILITSNGAAAL